MLKIKKRAYFFIFFAVVFFIALYFVGPNKTKNISIDGHALKVEVVSSLEKMQKGLGGRKELCFDCGMLFEFSSSGKYSFWMKGMLFPLDIIWINDGKIVYMKKNADFLNLQTLSSSEDANRVLEVNAGTIDKYDLKIGDSVAL